MQSCLKILISIPTYKTVKANLVLFVISVRWYKGWKEKGAHCSYSFRHQVALKNLLASQCISLLSPTNVCTYFGKEVILGSNWLYGTNNLWLCLRLATLSQVLNSPQIPFLSWSARFKGLLIVIHVMLFIIYMIYYNFFTHLCGYIILGVMYNANFIRNFH